MRFPPTPADIATEAIRQGQQPRADRIYRRVVSPTQKDKIHDGPPNTNAHKVSGPSLVVGRIPDCYETIFSLHENDGPAFDEWWQSQQTPDAETTRAMSGLLDITRRGEPTKQPRTMTEEMTLTRRETEQQPERTMTDSIEAMRDIPIGSTRVVRGSEVMRSTMTGFRTRYIGSLVWGKELSVEEAALVIRSRVENEAAGDIKPERVGPKYRIGEAVWSNYINKEICVVGHLVCPRDGLTYYASLPTHTYAITPENTNHLTWHHEANLIPLREHLAAEAANHEKEAAALRARLAELAQEGPKAT